MDAVERDVSGLLVRPADAGALATAIDRLRQDAQLRQRLGGAASMRVQQRFSVHDMCIQTEQLYRRLSGATI
jgi:glycosyltransferase involved in cell wall biosynthesis